MLGQAGAGGGQASAVTINGRHSHACTAADGVVGFHCGGWGTLGHVGMQRAGLSCCQKGKKERKRGGAWAPMHRAITFSVEEGARWEGQQGGVGISFPLVGRMARNCVCRTSGYVGGRE